MKKIIYLIVSVMLLGMFAGCNNTPTPGELQGISFRKKSIEIEVGESLKLRVLYEPEEAEEGAPEIVWESSKPKIASVSNSGKVEGLKVGTTTITATCGKLFAECEVEVVPATEKPVVVYSFNVVPSVLDVPAAGGTYSLEVQTNSDWKVSADQSWISLDTDHGTEDGLLNVTIAPADTKEITSGEIVFKYGEAFTKSFVVKVSRAAQDAKPITINDADVPWVPIEGGKYTITVDSELDWNVSCSDDAVVFSDKTETSVSVSFPDLSKSDDIAFNEADNSKSYTIEFSNGKSTATSKVNQKKPYLWFYTIWKIPVPATGGTYTVTVQSSTSWTATCSAEWVELSGASGSACGIIGMPSEM